MAARLQMRLGVLAEPQRLPESPDSIVVVEPSIGSIARSKGNLYLLVTSRQATGRAREAARSVGEAIRDQYYYDESAGIRVCLVKAIAAASKRLAHDRERYGLSLDEAGNGPIGVALAVVRARELYVATVGPTEAYLVRGGRLSTLPDPQRERGLPSSGLEAEVWRGEIEVGDVLILASPSIVAMVGADELRDALTTLRPQSAIERLHAGFVAGGGHGSDGAIAIEATEVSATQKQVELVPVRPSEPLAGAPDRSPIPLADSVSSGVATVQESARNARSAAGGAVAGMLGGLLDLMPRRGSNQASVTPVLLRRRRQQRVGLVVVALAAIVGIGAIASFALKGGGGDTDLSSLTIGQRALRQAQDDLAKTSASGIDLVADAPAEAEPLLIDAYRQLAAAASAGVPAATVDPLRAVTVAALDRLYHMVDVAPSLAFSFGNLKGVDLRALVRGPDGFPYVLDAGTKAVYRIDLRARKATPIVRAGTTIGGTKVSTPRFLTVGGPDILVLDAKNVLWRWRPADRKGNGTLARVKVQGSTQWGPDVKAIGTFVRNADAGLYNLYVADASEKQILRYSPAADGGGFPAAPSGYLQTTRVLDGVTQLYIDGDTYLVDAGAVVRFVSGTSRDWKVGAPGDDILRPAPAYEQMTSATGPRQGVLYAWDRTSARVIALAKSTGAYVGQFRLAGGAADWADVRAMLVDIPTDGSAPRLWWIDGSRLMDAVLTPVAQGDSTAGTDASGGSGAGSSATPRPSTAASPKASRKPSRSASPTASAGG